MSLETVVAFVLTLFIFSYLLGDNLLYRLAVYVLVGGASAFTVIVTLESVILPLLDGEPLNSFLFVAGVVVVGLLLLKPLRLFTPFSNLALALLVAVGTAVAVLGAIGGTILPFVGALAYTPGDSLFNAVVMFVGVVSSLLYFQYLARTQRDANGVERVQRGRVLTAVGTVGELFIAVTLGAVYGGAILTSLTVLSGHLSRLFGAS